MTVRWWAKDLVAAYGERGWCGVFSVCGCWSVTPNISELEGWKKRGAQPCRSRKRMRSSSIRSTAMPLASATVSAAPQEAPTEVKPARL